MHTVNHPFGIFLHLLCREKTTFQIRLHVCKYCIKRNTLKRNDTSCTPFFCQKCKSIFNRLTGILIVDFLSMQFDLSAFSVCNSENRLKQLCSSGTYKPCDAKHFSFSQFKRSIHTAWHIFSSQPFYFHQHFSRLISLLRETFRQISTYHQLDDFIHCDIFCRLCCDPFSITHDRNVIRNLQNLFHLMGNIYHTNSTIAQTVDDPK